MKNNNTHNQQCAAINSLLSLYGFVEEYETRNGKKEEQRFVYLQLKPTIGLLVSNFYHTVKKEDVQGFDMYIYNSNNVQDAISQFHGDHKYKGISKGLLGLQDKIEQTRIIIEQLQEEGSNDYFSIESKFVQLVKETYKRNINQIDDCDTQPYIDSDSMV